jgi:hypothetical protein
VRRPGLLHGCAQGALSKLQLAHFQAFRSAQLAWEEAAARLHLRRLERVATCTLAE